MASQTVNLGSSQANQQLVLGNTFMDDFKLLLGLLSDMSNALSTLIGVPPGAPLSPTLTLTSINLKSKCDTLAVGLDKYLSKTTKTS